MRSLFLIFLLAAAGIGALSNWRPGVTTPLPTPMPTLLPDDFTILPTFEPAYSCELHNVEVRDDQLCWSDRVEERLLVDSDGVQFIQHDYHTSSGCWGTIHQDTHELRVCSKRSGAVTTLTTQLTHDPLHSPDGEWLAFGVLSITDADGRTMSPHVYRVRVDGTDLQQLDTLAFPDGLVGPLAELRWMDDEWLALTLWDGRSGDESYHPYRLRADGSGVYEALPFTT